MSGNACIQRYSNVFPELLANALANQVSAAGWHHGWRSNSTIGYSHWNHDFAQAGHENGLDISTRLVGAVRGAWEFLKTEHYPNSTLIRCYANAHTYGVEGYPHTDSDRSGDRTLVVYMNRHWRREWGGETMIYDGDTISHAELPKFNYGLEFSGNVWHTARGVTRICPDLRMTLMFKFAPADCDILRDKIQRFLIDIGAYTKRHTKATLAAHLLETYDLLKLANLPDVVCAAGATHSIFGTNAFTDPCLSIGEVSKLEEVVGIDSSNLVRLFATVARPAALEKAAATKDTNLLLTSGGTVSVTEEQLSSLCALEAANLLQQGELGKYPNLQNFWKMGRV